LPSPRFQYGKPIFVLKEALPEADEHFLMRELEALVKLQHVPNVVDCPYWVNVYRSAKSADALILPWLDEVPWSWLVNNPNSMMIAVQSLVSTVMQMHDCNVAHGDLTLEHLRWNPDTNQFVLIDFNCATKAHDEWTVHDDWRLTDGYAFAEAPMKRGLDLDRNVPYHHVESTWQSKDNHSVSS
jgi:Lipopolysaccharide kinase (Kdo/WaaP) family